MLRDSFCFWGLNKYYKIYRPQIVLFAKLRFLALTRALCGLRRSHSIHLIADTKLSLNTPPCPLTPRSTVFGNRLALKTLEMRNKHMNREMTDHMMSYTLRIDITRRGEDIPGEILQGGERYTSKAQMDMKG